MPASKIEVSATKVKGFQCKAVATKSSILDNTGVLDPPLITIFGKVTFNMAQTTVILFNLIVIYGRSYLYLNYKIIFYQRRMPPSKNESCATKFVAKNGFYCKLLPQRAPS